MGGWSYVALPQWYWYGSSKFGKEGFYAASKKWRDPDMKLDLSGKVYLVTGGNAGIGYGIVQGLAERGATVHMACRNKERGEAARNEIRKLTGNENVHLDIVDVSNYESVKGFANGFSESHHRLDGLINNAGVMHEKFTKTSEGHESSMATMLGGSYLLTGLLVPLLKRAPSGRIVNVSSGGQYLVGLEPKELDNPTSGDKYDGAITYALSKRIQVALTEKWAEKLKNTNILVNSMHPGWAITPGVETAMPAFFQRQKHMMRSLEQGADTAIWLAASDEVEGETGKFFLDRSEESTHLALAGTSYSKSEVEKLWEKCANVCKFEFSA